MLGYAVRAVPWTRVVLAAGLVALLVELVRWDPWTLWPLEGAAVGLLAGAAAWCFDESAAAVVDPAPRGLAWRTLARAPGPLLLAVTWTAVVLHAGEEHLFGQRSAVWLQGAAALVTGTAYAAWRRAHGEATPGLRFATAVVPATVGWALLRPFEAQLAVFPYATTSARGWAVSVAAWAVLAAGASVVLGVVLADAGRWRPARLQPLRRPAVTRDDPLRRARASRRSGSRRSHARWWSWRRTGGTSRSAPWP